MDLTRLACGLHPVSQGHIIRPHVELEPLPPDNAAENGPCVNPDSHVDILVAVLVKLLDSSDHVQPHLDTIASMILARLRAS